jgi:hypothetical protein
MKKHNIYLSYKKNNKWLGIIEYKFLTIMLLIIISIWYILRIIINSFEFTVYVYIIIIIPIISFVFISGKSMNSLYMVKTVFKHIFLRKVYLRNTILFNNKNIVYKKQYKKDD